MHKVLAVIPARGGSKGLPGKNIRPLLGRPLINYTIEAALNSKIVDKVIVSTDDLKIADVARIAGAEVPFLRPIELATDTATSVDVLKHAILQCPGYSHILLLQPTSPLRNSADLDAAYELMVEAGSHSCVSICEVDESPWIMFSIENERRIKRLLPEPISGLRRQDLPTAYRLNGALYLVETDWFLSEGKLIDDATIGYTMPSIRSIDIDTSSDFERTEQYLNKL